MYYAIAECNELAYTRQLHGPFATTAGAADAIARMAIDAFRLCDRAVWCFWITKNPYERNGVRQ